jgi:hypothetical protein
MEAWKQPIAARTRDGVLRYALWPILAALATLTLGAGAGRAQRPPAEADGGTPGATTIIATRISVDEAKQAASQPGVDVEGSIPASPAPGNPYVCFRTGWSDLWTQWGYYQYHQRVYETRTWCGYLNDYQTYRVSGVHGGSDWCDWGAPTHVYRTAGGNGYFYTTVNSGVHFTCPALWPPWWPPHQYDDWQKWRCNMAGHCTWVDAGRS